MIETFFLPHEEDSTFLLHDPIFPMIISVLNDSWVNEFLLYYIGIRIFDQVSLISLV